MSTIIYTYENAVATITLNNPPQNRMSYEMQVGFAKALKDIATRKDVRVIYINANGTDFSFGGNVLEWVGMKGEEAKSMIQKALELMNLLENLPIPVVVATQGHCLGGGFELALRGDVIIAADNTKFGHPEATIGMFTLAGGIQRVADRIGRTRAIKWAITSELIDAHDAYESGLVTEVVPLSQLESSAKKWVKRLADGPTLAHADHKKLLQAWSNGGVESADKMIPEMMRMIVESEDAQGSITMAVEALKAKKKRPAYPFKGC